MLSEFFLIAGVHLLALLSPGPDFIMVTTRTLESGKKSGMYIAVGLGMGILCHSLFALLGLSYVIEHSVLLFSCIKIVGALYLLWISWHLIRAKKSSHTESLSSLPHLSQTIFQDIRKGFLTNLLNPKVSLFFLAIFSQIVSPQTSIIVRSGYALEMVCATIAWFSIVAWTIDKKGVRKIYHSIRHWIDRSMGLVLALLGCKLLFVSKDS